MGATMVDSNVLLDVMTEDVRWFAWSSEVLAEAADTGRLVINPIIYAEVSVVICGSRMLTRPCPGHRWSGRPSRSRRPIWPENPS
jgi:predicted nucleic acid-binding protein